MAGFIYAYDNLRKDNYLKRLIIAIATCICFTGIVNLFLGEIILAETFGNFRFGFRMLGLGILIGIHLLCYKGSWTIAVYESICAFMS